MCAKKTGSIEDLAVVGIDIGKDQDPQLMAKCGDRLWPRSLIARQILVPDPVD